EGKPPYFLIHKRQEEYGFSLIGYENEVIFSSVFYQEKSACTEAIRELKDYAQTAVISDMTRTVHTQKNAGNCGKEGLY
ncbi:MAG TPA: YegP family protein, partial [Lachnospiraceae bacterium]|nr:YegP family protein [Lachnospiraceae bacterium]